MIGKVFKLSFKIIFEINQKFTYSGVSGVFWAHNLLGSEELLLVEIEMLLAKF